MDFIEGLPMSEEKDKIFVVVDILTKYARLIEGRKTDSAKETIEVFYKNVYKLHRVPKIIVSDRDVKFKGNICRYF